MRRSPAARRRFTGSDGAATSLEGLGWTAALNRYRLLLSYNELGSMFDELKTSTTRSRRSSGSRTSRRSSARRARRASSASGRTACARGGQTLIAELEPLDDERLTAVLSALRPRTPDLDAIEVALAGEWDAIDPAGELALLRELASLRTTDAATVSSALGELAAAQEAVESLAGSDAARAASLAQAADVLPWRTTGEAPLTRTTMR